MRASGFGSFCAAVAWRNHPPAQGTPATVLDAVAHLDRVRAAKREARNSAIVTRHEQALAAARRRTELAAAKAGEPRLDASMRSVTVPATNDHRDDQACVESAEPSSPELPTHDVKEIPASGPPDEPVSTDVKVPVTAATLAQWAATWVRMCGDGDLVFGPLNDDEQTRSRYNLSAKQLRNIRNAATSGALRRKAAELRVSLPAGYTDRPNAGQHNHRTLTRTAA